MQTWQPTNVLPQHLLRQYLLGRLNAPADEALREQAERYFEDDDAYDEVLAVEQQLLDQYVRGELSATDHEAFTAYLDRLPDGAERLAFAQAWQQVIVEETPAESVLSTSPTVSLDAAPAAPRSSRPKSWSWKALFVRPTPVVSYALLMALFVLMGGMAWFVIRPLRSANTQLRAQLAQQTAERTAWQQKLQSLEEQSHAQQSRVAQLQVELERSQAQAKAQARLLAQLQTPASALLAWALTPTSARDTAPGYQRVELREGAKTILLNAQVDEAGRYAGYSVVLQTMPVQTGVGQLVWQQAVKRPFSLGQDLVLRLPARLFTETNYKLTLQLVKTDQSKPPASYYYFTVVKP